jgi:hypothetical protein
MTLRKAVIAAAVIGLICPIARADDESKKIVQQAIAAHGGAEKLAKLKDKSVHQIGKITIEQLNTDGKFEAYAGGKKFKQIIEFSLNGQDIKQETAFDGKILWVAVNGKVAATIDKEEYLKPIKEALHAETVAGLVMLGEKGYETALIGDGMVNDKPAVGIRVSAKDHKDVTIWFDKKTHLLVKIQNRGVDPGSMQEVEEERVITEYMDVDGQKRPKRAIVHKDGKKVAEVEFSEVKYLDKLDDSIFIKPE